LLNIAQQFINVSYNPDFAISTNNFLDAVGIWKQLVYYNMISELITSLKPEINIALDLSLLNVFQELETDLHKNLNDIFEKIFQQIRTKTDELQDIQINYFVYLTTHELLSNSFTSEEQVKSLLNLYASIEDQRSVQLNSKIVQETVSLWKQISLVRKICNHCETKNSSVVSNSSVFSDSMQSFSNFYHWHTFLFKLFITVGTYEFQTDLKEGAKHLLNLGIEDTLATLAPFMKDFNAFELLQNEKLSSKMYDQFQSLLRNCIWRFYTEE